MKLRLTDVAEKANNYYIESNNGFGKPSGIEITRANCHIISDEIYFYIISTEKLKDIIASENWRKLSTYNKF